MRLCGPNEDRYDRALNLSTLSGHAVAQLSALEASRDGAVVVHRAGLARLADVVVRSIHHNDPRRSRPSFAWQRQLKVDEFDRLSALQGRIDSMQVSNELRAAIVCELYILLAILDHHPPSSWSFRTRTGAVIRGDDAVAVAVYRMFVLGELSQNTQSLRADVRGLSAHAARLVEHNAGEVFAPESAATIAARLAAVAHALERANKTYVADFLVLERAQSSEQLLGAVQPVFAACFAEETERYARSIACAHAIRAVLTSCQLSAPTDELLPPIVNDRVVGLYIDSGLLEVRAPQRALVSFDQQLALTQQLWWAGYAITEQLFELVKSRETRSAETLTHGSFAQTGTVPAGRAIALLRRESGLPPWPLYG
jgi:hypothetical protein